MRNNIICVIGAILLAVLSGCISGTENPQQYDDAKFFKLADRAFAQSNNQTGLSEALDSMDYAAVRLHGKIRRDDSQKFLDETASLNISSKYKPAADEIRAGFESKVKSGAALMNVYGLEDAGYIEESTRYTREAGAHFERASELLKT